MKSDNLQQEAPQVEQLQPNQLYQVTPLSKYLAMALFIILPFVGGYVGYMFTTRKFHYCARGGTHFERMSGKRVLF